MQIEQAIPLKVSNTYLASKRLLDIGCASIALILLFPVLLIVAIVIKLTSKGPILFSQTRVGKGGKEFRIWKFRSMIANAEEMQDKLMHLNMRDGPTFAIKDDPRVTKVGKFIRHTCIDELPQLWNVITGEMTIVGPRPPTPREVLEYKPWHEKRLTVKPGLTCYWQISNKEMSFNDWVRSDIRYIENRSTLIDIILIVKTIPVFWRGHNK